MPSPHDDPDSRQLRLMANLIIALALLGMSVSVGYMAYRYHYIDPCEACRERVAPCPQVQD